jgi:membrane protein DedA with SNARE-associated domain
MLILASISETLVNETSHFVRDAGLPGVFALMAIGSACIPIPSEVVMLFAGFAVADPNQSASQHHMTMVGIVLAGLLGTMVGSWITYGIGRGGRLELLERHGSKLHMGPAQISRAERWFERFGEPVVFFGRMVPLIRAFVSLPAGVARMPFWRFSVLSFLGSIPWVLALAFAGHALGSDWTTVRKGFQYVDYLILLLIVAGIAYAIVRRRAGGARARARIGQPNVGMETGTASGADAEKGARPATSATSAAGGEPTAASTGPAAVQAAATGSGTDSATDAG